MYGDYSRGHEPDAKRGRSYRRVLLQQGRPLLDSDVAASVDALLGEVRATARGLGCAAASPDLGFLVTPGRLLAIFAEAVDDLTVTAGQPNAWIDYRHRYLGRYPALQIVAAGEPAPELARVTLPLLQARDTGIRRVALWARVEANLEIRVNGREAILTASAEPVRVEIEVDGATLDPLEIQVPAAGEVWLFALEDDEAAGRPPAFWIAPGSYHVDGLIADAQGGGAFPDVAFPVAAGFGWGASPPDAPPLDGLLAPAALPAPSRLVAYLEVFERHISHIEDPGIREAALGATDTTARAQLVAQVKLATLAGVLPAPAAGAAAQLRRAFDEVVQSSARLRISVPDTTSSTDPCALPDPAGYSGADNRLYRVEVHRGGGQANVRLKWSRDNGSELFAPIRLDEVRDQVVFEAGTTLAGGDIVELLSSVVDLGDDALAQVSAGGFQPAGRAVGRLAQLVAVEGSSGSDEVAFDLVDAFDRSALALATVLHGDTGRSVPKLRRWHGILDAEGIVAAGGSLAATHVLEDGVGVELSPVGSYRPGEYWQYEARVAGANDNGPWRPEPHGPQRRFAPLALLEFRGAAQPVELLAWLDERFSHPCDLDADAVAFAGGRVGSVSDTVQEALEELFEKPVPIVDTGCGELVVRPENDLQAVFDSIPAGGSARLCIHPGEWEIARTVVVSGKGDLVIAGAGTATRLRAAGVDAVLRFDACGNVRMQDLAIEGGAAALVGDGLAGALSAIDCGGLDIERVTVSCAASTSRRMSAVEVRSDAPGPGVPEVRVRDCHIEAGHAQVGLLAVNAASVDVAGNVISSPGRSLSLRAQLLDPDMAGRVGRLLVDDIAFGETDEFPNDFLLGGDAVGEVETDRPGRRIIFFLREWGNQFVAFTTAEQFDADVWRTILTSNGMQGTWAQTRAPDNFILANLRRLRVALVRAMIGIASTLELDAVVSERLRLLAQELARRNSFAAGGQGIVVAGSGTPSTLPGPIALLGDPRPDVRVTGNRVLGFVQGIHVATSHLRTDPRLAYRVTIADNTIHLRVPGLSRERHGIFVGSAYWLRIDANIVELRTPDASAWQLAPAIDAIGARGVFGPLVQIRENASIGTRNGVVAFALNPQFATEPTWRWAVSDNAHVGPATRNGGGSAESINWGAS